MDKVSWNAVRVLVALIASCCCLSTCTALITCYECEGPITGNCGQLSDLTDKEITQSFNRTYCQITSSGSTIARFGVDSLSFLPYDQYCAQTDGGDVASCFCNTTLCNNMKALTPPMISCYVCSSLFFIDNGCGNSDLWNPNSAYVEKDPECTACYKRQNYESIIRGCVKSVHTVDDGCTIGDNGVGCECSEENCNHASSLLPAYAAITISLIWKIFI